MRPNLSFPGFDPEYPLTKHDVILLDIDHTPTRVLHQTNMCFYTEEGLGELAQHLNPGGVFGLWADGFPEDSFTALLGKVFKNAESHTITFDNPLTGSSSEGTVYLAQVSLPPANFLILSEIFRTVIFLLSIHHFASVFSCHSCKNKLNARSDISFSLSSLNTRLFFKKLTLLISSALIFSAQEILFGFRNTSLFYPQAINFSHGFQKAEF